MVKDLADTTVPYVYLVGIVSGGLAACGTSDVPGVYTVFFTQFKNTKFIINSFKINFVPFAASGS